MFKYGKRRALFDFYDLCRARIFKTKSIIQWHSYQKYIVSNQLRREYGITNIKPFNFRGWHEGTCTFTGKMNNEKVFIKRSIYKESIDAEKTNIEYLHASGSEAFFHTAEVYGSTRIRNEYYVVESFIEGKPLSNLLHSLDAEALSSILLRLYKIAVFFNGINFIHCDLTPKNVLLSGEKLFLIDFEYSTTISSIPTNRRLLSLSKRMLKQLGGEYALGNGILDDSFSLIQVVKLHCPDFINKHYDKWTEINLNVLKFCYNKE